MPSKRLVCRPWIGPETLADAAGIMDAAAADWEADWLAAGIHKREWWIKRKTEAWICFDKQLY